MQLHRGDHVKIIGKSKYDSLAERMALPDFNTYYPNFPYATITDIDPNDGDISLNNTGWALFTAQDLVLVESPLLKGGETPMQNTFRVGDIYTIDVTVAGTYFIGCDNLKTRFDNGQAKYIRILRVDDDGAINRYEALDSAKMVINGGLWNSTSVCCFIDTDKYDRLRKVSASSIMQKVRNIARKLLDADTRTLVEAGYLDDSLALTLDGKEAVLGLVFLANKKELAAEAAAKMKEENSTARCFTPLVCISLTN